MNDLKNIRKGIFQVITCHHKDMIYIYSNFWWLKVSWWLGDCNFQSTWFLLDVNEAELQALFEEARWSDLFWEFGCSSGKEVIFFGKTCYIPSALKKMFQLVISPCLWLKPTSLQPLDSKEGNREQDFSKNIQKNQRYDGQWDWFSPWTAAPIAWLVACGSNVNLLRCDNA